jgi:pilus assembly protein CpaD
MPCHNPAVAGGRAAPIGLRGLLIAGFAAALAGCTTTTARDMTGTAPVDYRQRHPITVTEGKRTLDLFVGPGRGGLSPTQRAEVLAFAQTWRRDATGGVTIERPVGGPNERAARDTLKEVLSIMVHAGVPNRGIGIKPYQAGGDRVAALRLNYPQVGAQAGPCGLWPEDLGPTYDPSHYENRPYYNLGCATQRNLASMVANPSDLVQPRAEAPVYAAKRTYGMEKWRKGESPATVYPDTQRGAISDLGK